MHSPMNNNNNNNKKLYFALEKLDYVQNSDSILIQPKHADISK